MTNIPFTGLNFLFGSFVLAFLAVRFHRAYRTENNRVAKIFVIIFFCLGMRYLSEGIPAVFFMGNQDNWRILYFASSVFTVAGLVFIGYASAFVKFQKFVKPYTGFLVFLALIILSLYTIYPPDYFFINGFLSWKVNLWLGLGYFILLILTVIPLGVVFLRLAVETQDKRTKIRSIGLGLVSLLLILPAITDVFFISVLKLSPMYADIGYFFSFLILLITLLLTYKPLPKLESPPFKSI